MKPCCCDGYLVEVLSILGPTENIEGRNRLQIFKTLGKEKQDFDRML